MRGADARAYSGEPVRALAVDLDRTLAWPDQEIAVPVLEALRRVRSAGRPVLLASGRPHMMLQALAQKVDAFDALVAENGAVLDGLAEGWTLVRGKDIAALAREAIEDHGVPVVYGKVVISAPRGYTDRIRELVRGLPVEVVPHADEVMVVPAGATKASGVAEVLHRRGIPPNSYAAIGDGENDVPLLEGALLSAAVANATPEARAVARYQCRGGVGEGVSEFVELLFAAGRLRPLPAEPSTASDSPADAESA
jgi:hydroxymethylpyrimidine pyrophosphatase-like HAD family hydrolase